MSKALVFLQVRIPEEIQIISHRNAKSQMYLPFPVTWLIVRIEEVARSLVDRIERQATGKKLYVTELAFRVERTSPH